MNILNKLAITNLKLNKKRTAVTIIGIMLAVALICAASNMFTSVQKTLVEATIQDGGYYHLKLMNLVSGDIQKLENNRDIKDMNVIYDVGFSILENSKNPKKPYIHLSSMYDKNTFSNMSYKLKSGRWPVNNGEVVINDQIIENAEVPYKIGDKITLNLGTRVDMSGDIINPRSSYKEGNEKLDYKYSKEVTVVGIIEKPGKDLEMTLEAGYTALTFGEKYEKTSAYISLNEPYKYKTTFEEILGKDYSSSHANYKYSTNRELLRWQVFSVNDEVLRMLLSLVIFGVLIICFTSIFCIRNSFAISTTEKIKMYGILASVGATKKQIKRSVLFEATILGLIGIPLGIILGIVADFILIKICNVLLLPGTIQSGKFFVEISWIAIVVSIIMGFITIYLSALSSAYKASKVNPIESIRGSNQIKLKSKKLKSPKFINRIFGIGGVIAYKNLKRSRSKYRTTVLSLISSIFIFITMSSFLKYGFDMTNQYYYNVDYNVLAAKRSFDNVELKDVLKLGNINDYTLVYQGSGEGKGSIHIMDESKVNNNALYEGNIISVVALDSHSFKRYCDKLGINYDKAKTNGVLCDDHGYTDVDKRKVLLRYYNYKDGDTIESLYEEKEFSVKIAKVTDIRAPGFENYYINGGFLFVDVENFEGIEFAESALYIDSSDPDKLEKDIQKEFKTLSITNYDQQARYQKEVNIVLAIFMYGFITVITLIGVTNIFNTITANMNLRQKEFATLKSIGMTEKEFNRMINLETIFYSTKSLVWGIILGTIGSYITYKMFSTGFDSGFYLPMKPIIISILLVFILIFSIMRYSIKNINKQNIIETIRNENV